MPHRCAPPSSLKCKHWRLPQGVALCDRALRSARSQVRAAIQRFRLPIYTLRSTSSTAILAKDLLPVLGLGPSGEGVAAACVCARVYVCVCVRVRVCTCACVCAHLCAMCM